MKFYFNRDTSDLDVGRVETRVYPMLKFMMFLLLHFA